MVRDAIYDYLVQPSSLYVSQRFHCYAKNCITKKHIQSGNAWRTNTFVPVNHFLRKFMHELCFQFYFYLFFYIFYHFTLRSSRLTAFLHNYIFVILGLMKADGSVCFVADNSDVSLSINQTNYISRSLVNKKYHNMIKLISGFDFFNIFTYVENYTEIDMP